MLKTIIFDCDGVMFQSREANRRYYNQLLVHFGYPEMDREDLDYVHIHNVAESVKYIFRNHRNQDIMQVHQYRQQLDYAPFLQYMEMEPDLVPFLEAVKENYHLAIATNRTDTMDGLLREFSLQAYFGKVMTAANSRKPKPAPDPLLEIADHYSCTIAECIYIGDSAVDEETARGCGMSLIAFRNRRLNADYHVESFMEILQDVLPLLAHAPGPPLLQ